MMVELHYEDIEILDLDPEFFVLWLTKVCKLEGLSLGEINLIFCSDEYLLKMNQDHLDHDYYTDIITFDYVSEDVVSGDLFISVDRVRENGEKEGVAFLNELYRVIVHGVLHLCGYKDKSEEEARIMRGKENQMLVVSRETI